MKIKFFLTLITAFFINVTFAYGFQTTNTNVLTENIIIKFKRNLNAKDELDVFKTHNVRKVKFINNIKCYVVAAPSKDKVTGIVNNLRKRADVEYSEPDYSCKYADTIPNDPEWSSSLGNWPTFVNTQKAWDYNQGSSNIIVAVIDSGVMTDHPDLQAKIVPGYNFYNNNTNAYDVEGHGTGVAGIIGAIGNNSVGTVGMDWNCKIMPLRVTDTSGYATWSAIASALQYAGNNGARVANASFRCSESLTVQDAAKTFASKNGIFCASAGNDGLNITTANQPNIITVGAGGSGTKASYSNYGPIVDVFAPGTVWTTSFFNGNAGYGYFSGTSAASPIVAGLCSLLLGANPNLTYSQIDNIIKTNTDDYGDPGYDAIFSYGYVNAFKAMTSVTTVLNPPPTPTANGPAITIKNPYLTQVISGTFLFRAKITDTFANITNVKFFIDLVSFTPTLTDLVNSYYTISIDTTQFVNGSKYWKVVASDSLGYTNYVNVPFSVNNVSSPSDTTNPTITINSPGNNSTISGTITTSVSASDNVGVTKVEYLLDNVLIATSLASPFSTSINTTSYSNDLHTLSAKAYDAAGNTATSSVTLTIANNTDTSAPSITITSPASGTKIKKMTQIKVSTADNVGVVKVELYVDNALSKISTSSPFTTSIDPKKLSLGNHSVYCKAYDAAGNIGQSQTITIIK